MTKRIAELALLLLNWGFTLLVLGVLVWMVVAAFDQRTPVAGFVVLGTFVLAIGLVRFYLQRGFERAYQSPGPDALIERATRTLAGAPLSHARALLTLGIAAARAYYGQFGRARDELAEVDWDSLPAPHRASALQVRALIHYLSGDDPAAGLRCAREALALIEALRSESGAARARVGATYVDVGRVLVEGARPELAAALAGRVMQVATPQERLLTLWGAAIAHQQLNQHTEATALFAQLRARAPYCASLHAPPPQAGEPGAPANEHGSAPRGACAHHPELAASARCVRCGDFVCEPCRRPISPDASICPPCRERYAALREQHQRVESHMRSTGTLAYVGAALVALAAVPLLWLRGLDLSARLGLIVMLALWSLSLLVRGRSLRRLELHLGIPFFMLPLFAIVPVGWLVGGYLLWLIYGPRGRMIRSLEYQRALAATPEWKAPAGSAGAVIASLALLANLALLSMGLLAPFLR